MASICSLLRSVLYIPGVNLKALAKAANLPADAFIFDLEDSVSPNAKQEARLNVLHALQNNKERSSMHCVRINGTHTRFWHEDLAHVIGGNPDAIVVPKVDAIADLLVLSQVLSTFEDEHGWRQKIPIWAMIESPLGVINAYDIAQQERVSCLIMGTSDLGRALHVRADGDRTPISFALQQVVLAARAATVNVIDGVFLNIKDSVGFEHQCQAGAAFGFDGKTVIHPSQLEAANRIFLPSNQDIDNARRIVMAWEKANQEGKEICVVDDRLVERLHFQEAQRMLDMWQKTHGE